MITPIYPHQNFPRGVPMRVDRWQGLIASGRTWAPNVALEAERRGRGTDSADRQYYRELGVSGKATGEEIRSAYLKLAKKLHPDVSKDADDIARFKRVSEAYTVLSDQERRDLYDSCTYSVSGPSRRPKRTQSEENAPASPVAIAGTGLLMVWLFKAMFAGGAAALTLIEGLSIAPSPYAAP